MRAQINQVTSRKSRWLRAVPALLVMAAACTTGGDSVTQPRNNAQTTPWRLRLNHHAITTAVGASVQLTATAVSLDGTPLTSGMPPVVFSTTDTTVKVDASGKLVGSVPRGYVYVYAKMQSAEGNWTLADTAQVAIVQTPYAFSSLKMMLSGPTLVPANVWIDFDAAVVDAAGNPVRDEDGDIIYPVTYYTPSAPPNVFYLWNRWGGGGQPKNVGETKVLASAYLFGQVYEDSVTLKLTYPDSAGLFIHRASYNLTPSPSVMGQTDLTILKGGVVSFSNLNTTQNVSVVFDDQSKVVGGNIPVVPQGYAWQNPPANVRFPNLGKFTYKTSLGVGGTITVVDP